MIKGVKIIERIGENGRVTHFEYKGIGYWLQTTVFDKMTAPDFDKLHRESMQDQKKWDEAKKRIEARRAAMTPEERARQDEADRAVFERWQDEANTNMTLDGTFKPSDDNDFNPFRKDED